MEILSDFLEFEIFHIGEFRFRVTTLLTIVIIYLIAKVILWLIKKALFSKHKLKTLDQGNLIALFQIIRYVLWVIAITLIVETIGIKVTVILAGSAALLVGVGLGLQQTFNDFISGIILLTEGTTKVGDVLEIDGDVIMIKSIGLRTSKGLNRDEIVIIIPNSLITTSKVINWSHQSEKTRFKINVGVAYGSDVDLVMKVLEESVLEQPDIFDKNLISARFLDFGNSSLDFQILFYSKNVFRIEKVKSDIRKTINRKFIENNITVPFPQMDLHIRSDAIESKEVTPPTKE
ncbi:MAG: mechanosensitive ion channel protein MscS [Bacteroidetes bacterium]|nr:mechanosensitive ion channel [Bacteroidia bacterium]PCH66732.1 MAG: mechanosensitive ion channel protein MscS [Bacteroidota bacterium]